MSNTCVKGDIELQFNIPDAFFHTGDGETLPISSADREALASARKEAEATLRDRIQAIFAPVQKHCKELRESTRAEAKKRR